MKRTNKPLLLATLAVALVALLVCQSIYWMRVGSDGIVSQDEEVETLAPSAAKGMVKRFGTEYNSDKEYRLTNVYEVKVVRSMFPFTNVEKTHIDGPILKWYK